MLSIFPIKHIKLYHSYKASSLTSGYVIRFHVVNAVVLFDFILSKVLSCFVSFHVIKEVVLFDLISCCQRCCPVFSSPGPKVHGNYCHHLASVVCKLFTFQASSPKPLGQLEPNLAGMFLG